MANTQTHVIKFLKRCWKEKVIWLREPHYSSLLSHRQCRQQWIAAAEGIIPHIITSYNTINLAQFFLILVQVLQNVSNIIYIKLIIFILLPYQLKILQHNFLLRTDIRICKNTIFVFLFSQKLMNPFIIIADSIQINVVRCHKTL
jgi:hypothetical protein